jgi:hypothetical protein
MLGLEDAADEWTAAFTRSGRPPRCEGVKEGGDGSAFMERSSFDSRG